MTKPPTPPCIRCGRRKAVQRIGELLKCTACGAIFDDDPEEGGDYSARNPAARMERQERRRERRA